MSVKVMTIVGTRPEIIKLSRIIAELDKHTDHILVHTGQNFDYELNQIFFEELEIRKPDYYLAAVGETTADTIGQIISKADKVLEKERPDAVLFYGDTNSCLAIIAAKKRKIPIFHMEAGNRCFDQRVPEDMNRKIIDHLSDINMPLTEHARRYLLAEGIRPETVIKTGSTMQEVLSYYQGKIAASPILDKLGLIVGQYFVVSAHREENIDSEVNFTDLLASLNALAQTYQKTIIVSTHPRTRKKLEGYSKTDLDPRIKFLKPLSFFDYVKLEMNAACTISDSGTITEESAILGFPAITIRQAHERPEGMDEGILIMTGLKKDSILNAIRVVISQREHGKMGIVEDYSTANVSAKVVRIILSYIDYINRTIWFK